jgi:hypothetical protein
MQKVTKSQEPILTVRCDHNLYYRAIQQAEDEGLNKNQLVKKALEYYLYNKN